MLQPLIAAISGAFSGFSLGLIGGGGSVLAVPMLIYLVGISDAHLAIGTCALAVSTSAFANPIPHARTGHVRWRTAALFAILGVAEALGGWGGMLLASRLAGSRRALNLVYAATVFSVGLYLMARNFTAFG